MGSRKAPSAALQVETPGQIAVERVGKAGDEEDGESVQSRFRARHQSPMKGVKRIRADGKRLGRVAQPRSGDEGVARRAWQAGRK